MPSMNNTSNHSRQVVRRSDHNKKDLSKIMRPAKPRDNLQGAFAGKENANESASTNVKSRKTAKSKARTPIR